MGQAGQHQKLVAAARCAICLDDSTLDGLTRVELVGYIEASRGLLARYQRWPNGMFFEAGNGHQFAQCIMQLSENPERRAELVRLMDES